MLTFGKTKVPKEEFYDAIKNADNKFISNLKQRVTLTSPLDI